MSNPISEEQLTAWESLANSATPGPWEVGDRYFRYMVKTGDRSLDGSIYHGDHTPVGACCMCADAGPPVSIGTQEDGRAFHVHEAHLRHTQTTPPADWHEIVGANGAEDVCGNYDYEEGGVVHERDAHFIAAARQAVPALIDEVRYWRKQHFEIVKVLARLSVDPTGPIAKMVAEERESCAAVCDENRKHAMRMAEVTRDGPSREVTASWESAALTASDLATQIRARGTP